MSYKSQLTENILPFWIENALDFKNGGIFTCLDEKGEIYGREKSVWFQGRALWSFSKAYQLIDQNPAKGNIFKYPFHIPRLYIIMAMPDRGASMLDYAK